jgi:hypothetical protein
MDFCPFSFNIEAAITFANYIGSLSFAIPFCISKETKNDVNYGRNCGFKQK